MIIRSRQLAAFFWKIAPDHLRWALSVPVVILLFSCTSYGQADEVDLDDLLISAATCETCRQRADSLELIRQNLFYLADSVSLSRRAMIIAGDDSAERQLLARGQALAESIQTVALAQMAHELICAPLIEAFFQSVETSGLEGEGSRRQAEIDSLVRSYNRLRRHEKIFITTINPPVITPDDSPENLRWKAVFTQDLSDRVQRWIDIVEQERERLATRRRLFDEASTLLSDQQFLDPAAGLDFAGDGMSEYDSQQTEGLSAIIQELLAQMPTQPEVSDNNRLLADISEWLTARRQVLLCLSERFELEALHRERER